MSADSAPQATPSEILWAMEQFGGGFASALAKAWQRADILNYSRLRVAFPDLWREYEKMAALDKARQA